jgi:CheY-like chemotaxis protein
LSLSGDIETATSTSSPSRRRQTVARTAELPRGPIVEQLFEDGGRMFGNKPRDMRIQYFVSPVTQELFDRRIPVRDRTAILDIRLPDGNGIEVCRHVRSESRRDKRLESLTGQEQRTDRRRDGNLTVRVGT